MAMPVLNAKGHRRPRNHFRGSGTSSISTARLRNPKIKMMRKLMELASLEVFRREQSIKTRWICKNRTFLQPLEEINTLNSSTSICQAPGIIKSTKALLSGLIWTFSSQTRACQPFRLQIKTKTTDVSARTTKVCKRLWSDAQAHQQGNKSCGEELWLYRLTYTGQAIEEEEE